jgi:hypothetical protein
LIDLGRSLCLHLGQFLLLSRFAGRLGCTADFLLGPDQLSLGFRGLKCQPHDLSFETLRIVLIDSALDNPTD